MEQACIARKIERRTLDAHVLAGFGIDRGGDSSFLRGGRGRLRQAKTHVVLKAQRAFVGVVFKADAVAGAAGEGEGDALIGVREAACTIESDTARFDARGAGFSERWIALGELGVGGAHGVDADVAVAIDVARFLVVPATVRADDVVAVAGFAENGHDDFFEQAGVLAFEFRGFGGLHLKDSAGPIVLFEIDAVGLARDVSRGRWRRLLALDVAGPAALEIDGRGDARKNQGYRRLPARIPRRFISAHDLV